MSRPYKYCQNIGPKHLRGSSGNRSYCAECYAKMKERYARIENEGGPVEGLRGARMLAGGSFGYENTKQERARNLQAFFHYVMPHIPEEKANEYVREISKGPKVHQHVGAKGQIKSVKTYS